MTVTLPSPSIDLMGISVIFRKLNSTSTSAIIIRCNAIAGSTLLMVQNGSGVPGSGITMTGVTTVGLVCMTIATNNYVWAQYI